MTLLAAKDVMGAKMITSSLHVGVQLVRSKQNTNWNTNYKLKCLLLSRMEALQRDTLHYFVNKTIFPKLCMLDLLNAK